MSQLDLFGEHMSNDNKEDFGKHPVSLAEVKAEKERDGRLWTPRDVLISLLRDIDNGVISPTTMVVVHKTVKKDDPRESYTIGTASAGGANRHELVGILSEASLAIIEE